MDDVAIRVDSVSKTFKLPHEKAGSVKNIFINMFSRKRTYEEQRALRDISFEVKKGEFFGIVGRNGSGKSTLLKLISGIYSPDEGAIQVNGKLTPFIELGVGFNHELSGRDNVFLNGSLLGFNRKEMEAMYDEIVEFAELERFMDQKLKNYSSGMQVRLAFSIAIQANTDVLVLDEVLAVGDEAFQRKCYEYFAKLKRNKRTVILVTHSMDSVQQYCTSAIMIENGSIVKSGNTRLVARAYRELFMKDGEKESHDKASDQSANKNISTKVKYKNEANELSFNVSLSPKINIDDAVITFMISRDNGEIVYRWVSDEKLLDKISMQKNKKISLDININNIFPDGVFSVEVGVKNRDRSVVYANFTDVKQFEIINPGSNNNDIFWKPVERFTIDAKTS